MYRVEEEVWVQQEGFTFSKVPAGRDHSDEYGPQQSTHRTESREHLDTPGADPSCRKEKGWALSRLTS